MRFSSPLLLLTLGLLFAAGHAYAQQPTPDSTAAPAERFVYRPTTNPMLTAADSARERARQENARQLRKPGRPPAHGQMMPGQASAPPVNAPDTRSAPTPSSAEQTKDAKRREEANRKAAEAEKQRQKTLYKRAKKSS